MKTLIFIIRCKYVLLVAFVHMTRFEDQITFKRGDIEWEASLQYFLTSKR
jgi:hypothetical protein